VQKTSKQLQKEVDIKATQLKTGHPFCFNITTPAAKEKIL
jgi:hypothetical protein